MSLGSSTGGILRAIGFTWICFFCMYFEFFRVLMGFGLLDFTSCGLGFSHWLRHCASWHMHVRESFSFRVIILTFCYAMLNHTFFNYLS